jgi:hypothetical protein
VTSFCCNVEGYKGVIMMFRYKAIDKRGYDRNLASTASVVERLQVGFCFIRFDVLGKEFDHRESSTVASNGKQALRLLFTFWNSLVSEQYRNNAFQARLEGKEDNIRGVTLQANCKCVGVGVAAISNKFAIATFPTLKACERAFPISCVLHLCIISSTALKSSCSTASNSGLGESSSQSTVLNILRSNMTDME